MVVKHFGQACRPETIGKGFPIEVKHFGIHADRKLFAKGFLLW